MKLLKVGYILLALLVCLPNIALAHGLATANRQVVGNYVLEFEYDTTGLPVATELTLYNFDLLDKVTGNQVNFDRVFVKIADQENKNVFSSNLSPVNVLGRQKTLTGIVLSNPGLYQAELQFYNAGQQLSGAKFSFDVGQRAAIENSEAKKYTYWFIITLLLVIIVILVAVLKGKKRVVKS